MSWKIPYETVLAIYRSKAPRAKVAEQFNVSETFVARVRTGKSKEWAWLTLGPNLEQNMPKKIADEIAAAIMEASPDATGKVLAKRFGVSEATVARIRRKAAQDAAGEMPPPFIDMPFPELKQTGIERTYVCSGCKRKFTRSIWFSGHTCKRLKEWQRRCPWLFQPGVHKVAAGAPGPKRIVRVVVGPRGNTLSG